MIKIEVHAVLHPNFDVMFFGKPVVEKEKAVFTKTFFLEITKENMATLVQGRILVEPDILCQVNDYNPATNVMDVCGNRFVSGEKYTEILLKNGWVQEKEKVHCGTLHDDNGPSSVDRGRGGTTFHL